MLKTELQSGNARYFVCRLGCKKSKRCDRRGHTVFSPIFRPCCRYWRRGWLGVCVRFPALAQPVAAAVRRLSEKRHEARRGVKAAVGRDGALERGDVIGRGEHAHAVKQLREHRHVLPGLRGPALQDGVRAHDGAHAQARSAQNSVFHASFSAFSVPYFFRSQTRKAFSQFSQ